MHFQEQLAHSLDKIMARNPNIAQVPKIPNHIAIFFKKNTNHKFIPITKASKVSTQNFGLVRWSGPPVLLTSEP